MLKSPKNLKKADDLFEKSSMTFGEHLEALRKSLVGAFICLGIGMAIGLPMANRLLDYLQGPLKEALDRYETRRSRTDIEAKTGQKVSDEFFEWMRANERYWQRAEVDIEDLRRAVSEANLSTTLVSPQIDETKEPSSSDKQSESTSTAATAAEAANDAPTQNREPDVESLSVDRLRPIDLFLPLDTRTEALGMQEPFMIWLKAGFALGFVIASPGIFYSLWTFIAAGLYPHERRYVYFFLPISIGLFLAGAGLAFGFIFQFVIDFLLKFNEAMNVDASPRLTDYMSFAIFLPLGFGIAFQLPLAMLVMERLGIFTVKTYLAQWRAAVLIIAFVSMILTPAEPTSMIGMAVPLIGLYFFGIGLCHWLPRKGSPHEGYDPT